MEINLRILVAQIARIACITCLLGAGWVNSTFAQDDIRSGPMEPTTVSDAGIALDHLQVRLRPLTQDELKIELAAWLGLLKDKVRSVGETELSLLDLEEGESDVELRKRIIDLRSEEESLAQRSQMILEALKAKGGDVLAEEQYLAAVSDISKAADFNSYIAAIRAEISNWIKRDDGGKLWLRRILVAMGILLVFWIASRFAGRITAKALSRHHVVSSLLENFARRTAGGVLFVVGILTALSVLGVQIGPLMAALGAGGFIVGFALQDTLANFASGMMIMVYRPFDVDDFISVAGGKGNVKQMSLVSTKLLTVDNKVLIIPNKSVWSDTIVNYTGSDTRRVDLEFGIGYDDSIQKAINVLSEVARDHPLVLADPGVKVDVDELGDSAVVLFCRSWVNTADYWSVRGDLIREVKSRFDQEGISFPYPQQDVHLDPPQ